MIEVYTGSVGSGKSYHALYRAYYKVRQRSRNIVVANFPCKFSEREVRKGIASRWIYLDNSELSPARLVRIAVDHGFVGKEGYALLVIDEAAVMFNARDWQVRGRERLEWIKFFAQSRKLGYDVVLIAQDLRMLDRQIRSLAEYVVRHASLRNYWWFSWLPWPVFVIATRWTGGAFRPRVSFLPLFPWVANRYDTMRMFDLDIGGLMRGEGERTATDGG